jgi:hypothetical protein
MVFWFGLLVSPEQLCPIVFFSSVISTKVIMAIRDNCHLNNPGDTNAILKRHTSMKCIVSRGNKEFRDDILPLTYESPSLLTKEWSLRRH